MTLKELKDYRNCRANRERVETFIEQCEDPFIKQIMIKRYIKRLSWIAVSAIVGNGSPESCRMLVRRWVMRGGRNEKTKFTFNFKGGQITVWALNEIEGRILAQAEAINRGWDYTIFAHPIEKGGEQNVDSNGSEQSADHIPQC